MDLSPRVSVWYGRCDDLTIGPIFDNSIGTQCESYEAGPVGSIVVKLLMSERQIQTGSDARLQDTPSRADNGDGEKVEKQDCSYS